MSRLIDFDVGTFFRSPRWSENAVGELVGEPLSTGMAAGLARIHVHCRQPDVRRPSSLRARLASESEMERQDWEIVDRPGWVNVVGGSGGS